MSKGTIICRLLQELYNVEPAALLLEQDPGRTRTMRLYSYGHIVIWIVDSKASDAP